MKVGVLALQGDVREHEEALESAGATPVSVKRPDQLDGVDALVLPGGESTTIGKLLARFELLEPIRRRVQGGMPLFGTCAGLITMSRAVSGDEPAPHRLEIMDITVRRNAYGRQVDSFETDIGVWGIDEPLRVAFIRAPAIERVGRDVEVLARHDGQPVLVRQGRLLGSTFHPEITGERRVHELFLDYAGGGG
jgi:pyridoxal 5'-phosphate synthase pdxT subunit